jgi:hypothetical protein
MREPAGMCVDTVVRFDMILGKYGAASGLSQLSRGWSR